MNTKPIHWWKKALIGWKMGERIKTDMLGQYGSIATTYGNGRVVIFTGEPEIQTVLDGTIEEFVGRSTGYGIHFPPIRVVYSWAGTHMNMSHNWWIHRRAAAWIAGVPDSDLPPCNELMVFIDKPESRLRHMLYVNDELKTSKSAKKIVSKAGMTVIKGNITVEAYAENSDIVEFYLDGLLEYTATERPFKWKLDKKLDDVHSIEVRSYDEYGSCVYEGSEFLFSNLS